MSRQRRGAGEVQFGSDSFLDVVANIVGILIILIVIAGLRISKTPLVAVMDDDNDSAEVESIEPDSTPIVRAVLPLPELIPDSTNDAPDESQNVAMQPIEEEESPPDEPEPPPPPLPPLVVPRELVPRELVEMAEKIETDISALKEREEDLAERMQQSSDLQSQLRERQQAIQTMMAEKKRDVDESHAKVAKLARDVELARQTLVRLTKQVEELESEPENVETLEHSITPLSRVVNGKEKHYRLEKNRVSEVPLEELITRFREQIDRRKDWLAKTRQHQGQIGPIRGFSMNYIVRVESMSDLDRLKNGYGGYRISLAQWEIQPEPDMKGETAEVALRKGSQFYQSILGTAPDTTLTFWVYPDSFELFRKLQKFTHEHGYSVAARPLPTGMPIAGSPNGSKSASQ